MRLFPTQYDVAQAKAMTLDDLPHELNLQGVSFNFPHNKLWLSFPTQYVSPESYARARKPHYAALSENSNSTSIMKTTLVSVGECGAQLRQSPRSCQIMIHDAPTRWH